MQPLNADKIGRSASGTASFEIKDGNLTIEIDASGLTPGLLHMQHFHGFPDGKNAECPTSAADVNGDGYVDLLETEPASGTTMVPFHAHPATLEIPSDTYPVADKSGAFHYQKTESVEKLEKGLQEKFKAPGLASGKAGHHRARRGARHQAARYGEVTSRRACADDAAGCLRSHRDSQLAALAAGMD